jgi:hypothetical protein
VFEHRHRLPAASGPLHRRREPAKPAAGQVSRQFAAHGDLITSGTPVVVEPWDGRPRNRHLIPRAACFPQAGRRVMESARSTKGGSFHE